MCRAFEEARREGDLGRLLQTVKDLMKNMNWSLEQAMKALSLTDSDKAFLYEKLGNN